MGKYCQQSEGDLNSNTQFLLLVDTFLMQKNLCNKLPVMKSESQVLPELFYTACVLNNVHIIRKICASIFLLNKNMQGMGLSQCLLGDQ